ncbi:MAG: hypothetical protein JWO23_1761 [Solirubrobacterales bacterium]|jgi:hypothetical protein|nr:hypothetical protein [Solirubrobacterales bacterium]
MTNAPSSRERRTTAVVVALALVSLVAGIALLLAVDGVGAMVTGIVLVGLAGIAFVSLAFLLVGQGEDRDRAHHPHG